ncbi:MAG: T9SS type A sorting domain-containing protein [Chitinophagaceae bacterium]
MGVTDLADEALNVFPNPADRILYIQGLDASHQSISITDLFGIQYSVLPVPSSGKTTLLDINHLKTGIYILSYSKGGRTGHIKFVKN